MAIGNLQHIHRNSLEDGVEKYSNVLLYPESRKETILIEAEFNFLTPPSCCQLEALVAHWLDFVHEEQPDFERSRVLLAGI